MPPKPSSPPLTHFLCLPLATFASTAQLTASITRLAKDQAVLRSPSAPAPQTPDSRRSSITSSSDDGSAAHKSATFLPPKAIRPAGTLHLTLGVMRLRGKDNVEAAVQFLDGVNLGRMLKDAAAVAASTTSQEPSVSTAAETGGSDARAKEAAATADRSSSLHPVPGARETLATGSSPVDAAASPPQPLVLKLQGLHPMAAPHETSVLYAQPHDPTNRLFHFAKSLRDEFERAGFVLEEKRELKLHATIVNTIYAKEKKGRGKGGGRGRGGRNRREGQLKFDATELVERWKDEVWAEVKVERVAVCEMGAKEDEEGKVRYVEVGAKKMPG
ncbi:MAG: hypothetical protein LQ340_005040 [Diploschistes diacapsis]|nr:MAG: hypothetical protein LQ340_005040 [Diploschistes diacapsis]